MTTDIYARLRDLAASAEANPSEMRPVLLRVTTDLFALNPHHTEEEIRLYAEMTDKLLDDADEPTLTIVARKLSRCADAPSDVLRRIRARGGEPARELLLTDRKMDWRELRQIATCGACDQACAVAARPDLDRELSRMLAARPEREIARALAANTFAPLAIEDLRFLTARGRDDAVLARALLDRSAPTLDHLPLYLSATPSERSKLLALAVGANLAQAGRPSPAATADEASAAAIEAAAVRKKRARFALTLADRLPCDSRSARRIVDDESGDALALAFIAIGLPPESAARIFLIAFPKVALSPKIFERNLRLFQSVPQRAAARMIEAVTGAPRGQVALKQLSFRSLAAPRTLMREEAKQTARPETEDRNRA